MTDILAPVPSTDDDPHAHARRRALHPVRILIAVFVSISAATEAVIIGVSVAGDPVDGGVWARCSIVLAGSLVLLLLVRAAANGHRHAFVRARIVSIVVAVVALVIASIPGFLPDLVRLEQAACGVILIPAAILLNRPSLNALLPKPRA